MSDQPYPKEDYMPKDADHLVDPGPAREHLATLMPHTQFSVRPIASAAGLSWNTVERAWFAKDRISRWSQDRILAVSVADLAPYQIWHSAAVVQAHLIELSRHEDFTMEAAAAASGTSNLEIREIMQGDRRRVQVHIYEAVMRLDPATVRKHARMVTSRIAVTRIRALQAQAWPIAILAKELGYSGPGVPFLTRGTHIKRSVDLKVERLYHRLGDRRGPSAKAAALARKLGFWPAIHYTDDMRLIRSSIPRESRRRLDDGPPYRRWLRIMAYTARGMESGQIVSRLGITGSDPAKHVERAREQIGLRLLANLTVLDASRVMPGQEHLLAAIREHTAGIALAERFEHVDEPGLDYEALWCSLVDTADLLHGAGAAGVPAASWPEPENHSQFAATLTAAAA